MTNRTPNLRHLWRWPPDPERYAVPVDEDGETTLPEDPTRLRAGNNPWSFVYVAEHPDLDGWIVDAPAHDEKRVPGAMISRGPMRYRGLPERFKRRCYRCRVVRREGSDLRAELASADAPRRSPQGAGALPELEYHGPETTAAERAREMATDPEEPDVREMKVPLGEVRSSDVPLEEPREPHGFAGEHPGRGRYGRG